MVSDVQIGWIVALETERQHLVDLGIKLGPYDSKKMAFEQCEATGEQIDSLQEFLGKYYWRFW